MSGEQYTQIKRPVSRLTEKKYLVGLAGFSCC